MAKHAPSPAYRWRARLWAAVAAAATTAAGLAPLTAAQAAAPPVADQFVQRVGDHLTLAGQRYTFAGANNYYPLYQSPAAVDALFDRAKASGFEVMRVWGSGETGTPGGSDSVDPGNTGIYLQSWDAAAGRPAFNDGANGIQRLDRVIASAKARGIRLVVPLVNNWNNFGGIDQYVRWAGRQHHDDFYTDATIAGWYRAWVNHVLNRKNPLTGLAYKDDPTIMMWELANEPRCQAAQAYPASSACTTDTLVRWADTQSAYLKSIDHKHLLGTGDEGFYAKEPASGDFTRNGADGVDSIRLARLQHIDVLSWHLYPDAWGKPASFGGTWITEHVKDAKKLGKPGFMGEFGLLDKATRNPVYQSWTTAFTKAGGDGALFWLLSDKLDDGSLYPDYDGFTVYCPGPVCTTLSNFDQVLTGQAKQFPPVADHDTATVAFGAASVTLKPLANDVSWNGTTLAADKLDLDPATAGYQSTRATADGTWQRGSGGTVTFTPAAGFSGDAGLGYTVRDSSARLSNVATVTVTVKADPAAAATLFSFEQGTQGWAPLNHGADGSVATTTAFHTAGAQGLEITSRFADATSSGDWFGAAFGSPVDLSGKNVLSYDLRTGDTGTATEVVLQNGSSWTWCAGGGWSWVNPNTTTTVSVPFSELDCSGATPDWTKVQALYVWAGNGTQLIDDVRAEATAGPTRIMALGDSITGSPGCWRALLWNKLKAAGYPNLDLVGSLNNAKDCGVEFDGDNEGHGGILVTDIAAKGQLPGWLDAADPDIVLMHLGTNDVWSGRSTDEILAAYTTLVGQMRAANPAVRVLVARIIPTAPASCAACPQRSADLDNAIPAWAAGLSTAASPVVAVDQWTGWDPAADTADGVHPNAAGIVKVADRWYPALKALLDGGVPASSTEPVTWTAPTGTTTTTTTTTRTGTGPGRTLFSFEDGVDGFAGLGDAGVKATTAFHTDGGAGLEVTTAAGDWVGAAPAQPLDLSGAGTISYDVRAGGSGTATDLAVQTGSGWNWCQGANWPWVDGGATGTVTVDLSTLSCPNGGTADLSDVRRIMVYLGPGTTLLDNLRVDGGAAGTATVTTAPGQ